MPTVREPGPARPYSLAYFPMKSLLHESLVKLPLASALACALLALPVGAAVSVADLADLSIEQLMNESVTSVSKKATNLDQAPAAISVITGDDIRKLGITSIPEALRLAPGLNVARINNSQWAVSSRGFNLQYANKLQVLMDGRSVYTPSFGGVYWDAQDMMLEDLERIEVIRGPGATLWGANAVNGVINITSKSSKDTQGGVISTSTGSDEQAAVSLRYGGAISNNFHYRAYLKYFDRDSLVDEGGNDTPDAWESIRGGFRTDWEPTVDDLVTFQGDYYSFQTGEYVETPIYTPPFSRTEAVDNHSHGGNLLGRWTRTLSEKSQFSLQAYFDSSRHGAGVTDEARDTADIQFEYRFPLGTRNDFIWGLGYRHTHDEFTDSPFTVWTPESASLKLYSTFVQDELTLIPDRLRLILSSKFEHNDYTGWEIQPGLRLLWTPTRHQTLWASASHAAGTPARLYRDARVNLVAFQPETGPVLEAAWIGNSEFDSETVDAFEIGYRIEPAPNLSLDLATFYNIYDHLTGVEPGTISLEGDHVLVPYNLANNVSGEAYGVEASVQWMPLDQWRLTANYSWLHMDLRPYDILATGSAQQQVSLRSYLKLPWNLEFNTYASFVDDISAINKAGSATAIPSFLRLDAGLIWHPTEALEIGIWGQNLLDGEHPEFPSQNTSRITEIPRSVIGKITWRF